MSNVRPAKPPPPRPRAKPAKPPPPRPRAKPAKPPPPRPRAKPARPPPRQPDAPPNLPAKKFAGRYAQGLDGNLYKAKKKNMFGNSWHWVKKDSMIISRQNGLTFMQLSTMKLSDKELDTLCHGVLNVDYINAVNSGYGTYGYALMDTKTRAFGILARKQVDPSIVVLHIFCANKGFGRKLLNLIEQNEKSMYGAKTMVLCAVDPAKGFYEKLGYVALTSKEKCSKYHLTLGCPRDDNSRCNWYHKKL